jgi:RHS repeat-associated protein
MVEQAITLGASYYRARYYDPAPGRFLSEDPIGFNGGQNFYAYVRNNPLWYADPSGLIPCEEKIRNMLNNLINSVQLDCSNKPVFDTPGTPTGQVGGHKNYKEVSRPLSPQDLERVLQALNNSENKGVPPGYRVGGPFNDLHINDTNDGGGIISVTAHVDIGNPNNGLLGMITHGIVDGLGGHVVDLLSKKKRSIDVNCTK